MHSLTPETEVLVRAVRSFVTGRADAELAAVSFDARRLFDLARSNKLGVPLRAGLIRSLGAVPASLQDGLNGYQAVTAHRNAANLTTLREIVPLLERAGLSVVVLKGPAHQQLIYGNYFTKPAADVDLLVPERDYDRAARLLLDHGLTLPSACDTPWWRHFLGEQPFLSPDPSRLTVDLHHRTQQPGCPAPRSDGYFLQDVERVSVAGVAAPTLSRRKSTLLACMNIVKAIFHREPTGGHVCDVAAYLNAAEASEVAALLEEAGGQGLRNTALFGLRCAAALLDVEPQALPASAQGSAFLGASAAQLLWMTLGADLDHPGWPKRRQLLWELCDNKADYPRELSWAAGGEAFRRLFEPRPADARQGSAVAAAASPPPVAGPSEATPPVAVIITAKNASATIAKSVASALAQSAAAEVVVVDDGSTDDTGDVARSADDGTGRLKVLRLDENRGPSTGRNIAIDVSISPYICVLDADDFLGEGRLQTLFARGGEGWDLLADDMLFTSSTSETDVFDRLLPDGYPLPSDLALADFVKGNVPRRDRYRRELGFLKPLIRREFLDRHGLRYDETVRLGEDYLLYAECLLAGGRFRVVEACGYYAVERRESLSGNHRTSDLAHLHVALQALNRRARAAGQDVRALAPKAGAIRRNLAFRTMLDAKHAGDWGTVWKAFLDTPAGAANILVQTARAKLFSKKG